MNTNSNLNVSATMAAAARLGFVVFPKPTPSEDVLMAQLLATVGLKDDGQTAPIYAFQ